MTLVDTGCRGLGTKWIVEPRADPNFKQDSIERWAWAQVAEDADAGRRSRRSLPDKTRYFDCRDYKNVQGRFLPRSFTSLPFHR